MDDATDHHDMDHHDMDHHDMDPAELDPPDLDPVELDDPGLDHPGLEPTEPGAAGPEWTDDLGAGQLAPLAGLTGADPADLSFAEDLDPAVGPGVDPALDDDPSADLHDLAGTADPAFGTDPDLHPLADVEPAPDPPFPPSLGVDPPEPIDGYPWTDPAVLGHDPLPALGDATGGPDPAELFEYAGEQPPADGDPWAALLAAQDPATSALARWWAGQG